QPLHGPRAPGAPSNTRTGAEHQSGSYNFFGFLSHSVRPEHPWIVGESQEKVAGLRPLDEPVRYRNSWPLGTKSHEDDVIPWRDKVIDVRADSNSRYIEREIGRASCRERV